MHGSVWGRTYVLTMSYCKSVLGNKMQFLQLQICWMTLKHLVYAHEHSRICTRFLNSFIYYMTAKNYSKKKGKRTTVINAAPGFNAAKLN